MKRDTSPGGISAGGFVLALVLVLVGIAMIQDRTQPQRRFERVPAEHAPREIDTAWDRVSMEVEDRPEPPCFHPGKPVFKIEANEEDAQ